MPAWQTPLCRLLGIDVPIIQAPIGNATCPALAAAVSNAGGLGMLSVTWRSLPEVRQMIRETRELTRRPFGVNLVLQWRQDDVLPVCLEEGVPVVSFFWGDPAPYREMVHASGAKVMYTVGSAKEARYAVEAGVDVVVAQGWEAGGHVWSEVALLPLIPAVVDAVAPVPVVAAGGIGDGRGIAAALSLGASGVWLGTRFLLSEEAAVPLLYKEKVMNASETDTVYTKIFDLGWPDAPHRTLRNSTVMTWEAAGRPPSGRRPGEGEIVARLKEGIPLPRYSFAHPLHGMTGDLEALALYAGQSAGLLSEMKPAAEIVRELVEETAQALRRGLHCVEGT
jgi:nitronate monooxygenase